MNENLIEQLAKAVSAKITPAPSTQQITDNWMFYERAQPTTSSEVIPENTAPPPHFDNRLCENDLNDAFDENQLLKFVPKRFKGKARELLEIFDERPNEITWDTKGVIFVDQTAIPDSNIFTLFPYLFRRKVPKDVLSKGFSDFLKKVVEMKLGHLVNCNTMSILGPLVSKPKIKSESVAKATTTKWWFLN